MKGVKKGTAVFLIAVLTCTAAAVPAFAKPKNQEKKAYRDTRTEYTAQLRGQQEEIKNVRAEIKEYSGKWKAFNKARKNGEADLDKETLARIRELRLELKEIRGRQAKPASEITWEEAPLESVLEIDAEEEEEILETEPADDEEGPGIAENGTDRGKKNNEVKQLRKKAKEAAAAGNYDEAESYLSNALEIRSGKLEKQKRIRDKWKEITALLPAEYR